ncbi:MAG: UvrD-helicase domain-containing protein [Verrucomicrobia bacterium]|nr:UvrD-helicase domain-containing protein [Verrucomicrobiota bacterium]MDA1202803.1 UvrD-helicase domain-containing protein [Verrucomicrobiota bacterium]
MKPIVREPLQRRLLILANAGSGKTYELVTRCIKLLSLEQPPEEIIALTFTRKAAAEFLQKLFERLGDAADDANKRGELARDLGVAEISREQCIAWVHKLIDALPRLSMGTMDQFFGRIVRGFPLELGLSREFELLDDATQQENLRVTLERLFREGSKDKKALGDLLELLRQSNRNRSGASALRDLQEDITKLHAQIAGPSKNVAWGDEHTIWAKPEENRFLSAPPLADVAPAFLKEVLGTQEDELGETFHAYLEDMVQRAVRRAPQAGLGPHLTGFLGYLGNKWKLVKKENAETLSFGHKGRLLRRGEVAKHCDELKRALIGAELRSRLSSSAAVHRLLRRYEEIYEETVRSTGALTFSDVTEILTGHSGDLKGSIAYRLDSRHNHWLLDEFQDTSRAQWEVLDPLVSEVIMDPSDDRTFFYVGDTKQSIYGWRGGDDRLFREIFRYYNQHKKDHIEEAQLALSYRSDKAIIEVVNAAFDKDKVAELAKDFDLPSQAVERWKAGWVEHLDRKESGPGYVRLHDLAADSTKDDTDVIDRELVRLLTEEIKPIERNLSCAILTRSGRMAEHYAKVLEKAGVATATEGRFVVCQANPEGLALLSAVRCVASLGDGVAEAHFLASPFGVLGRDSGISLFRSKAMASAFDRGFAATIRDWVDQTLGIDPSKVVAFIDAAAEFDAKRKPDDDWRSFSNHLEHYSLQENESPGVVRVMTVHKAKGLGMDVVILPELGGYQSLSQLKPSGISLVRDHEGKVSWGLDLPPADMCEEDEALRRAREDMKANQAFGELCVFYVAMTRAKHAVYCLTAERQKRKNAARWLMRSFPAGTDQDAVREVGDKEWFARLEMPTLERPVMISDRSINQAESLRHASSPSSHEGADIPAGLILGGGAARHLGTEVHELLAQVEWLGNEPDYTGATPEGAKLVREFLASDRAVVMTKPGENFTVWRERAFDVEVEGRAVSGIFDRVHIELGEDGQVASAQIYDFKTDQGNVDLLERYNDQLDAYRQAVALLLGISANKVESKALRVRS